MLRLIGRAISGGRPASTSRADWVGQVGHAVAVLAGRGSTAWLWSHDGGAAGLLWHVKDWLAWERVSVKGVEASWGASVCHLECVQGVPFTRAKMVARGNLRRRVP